MSQYPYSPLPYTPPPPPRPSPLGVQEQLLAPARTAGILQIVLGAVLALTGTCMGSMMWLVPTDQLVAEVQSQNPSMAAPGVPVETLKAEIMASSIVLLVVGAAGLVLLILGIFVRGGGRVVAAVSLGLNGVVGAVLLLGMLNGLARLSSSAFTGVVALMLLGSLAALCAATVAKLVETIRASINLAEIGISPGAAQWKPSPLPGTLGSAFGYPPPPPAGATPVGIPQPPLPESGAAETRNQKPEIRNNPEIQNPE